MEPISTTMKGAFPSFDNIRLTTEQKQQVDALHAEYAAAQRMAKNNNPVRQARASRQTTVDAAKKKYAEAQSTMLAIAEKAQALWVEVTACGSGTGGMRTGFGGNDIDDDKPVTRGEFKQLMIHLQQQHQQQRLELQNGGDRDSLNIVRKMAMEKMLVDEYDDIKTEAIEFLLEDDVEAVKEHALENMIKDPPQDLWDDAAKKLMDQDDEAVTERAVEMTIDDPPLSLLSTAAKKLLKRGDEAVTERAVEIMVEDPPQSLLNTAAKKLLKRGDEDVTERAVEMMVENPSQSVLNTVAKTLQDDPPDDLWDDAVKQLLEKNYEAVEQRALNMMAKDKNIIKKAAEIHAHEQDVRERIKRARRN